MKIHSTLLQDQVFQRVKYSNDWVTLPAPHLPKILHCIRGNEIFVLHLFFRNFPSVILGNISTTQTELDV